ncbi:MAG: glycoside hydrolase family 2 [Ruminococcaceae bacterium]|nr:glycoside hydrolase family 2 [Oscillospiraceae bacterium]
MKESRIRMAVNDLFKKKEAPRTVSLTTPWSEQPETPWNEYPRPQLKRDSFFCLNGKWRFAINGEEKGEILVPYPPESALSGVDAPEVGDQLTYEREFVLPEGFRKDRVLLHFGAVDQECTVYLNDIELGSHEGGYLPFSFDVTEQLRECNTLRVIVFDPLDTDLPYGKQKADRGGMWYTPVSGIWQTVWMESVPEQYIRGVKLEPSLDSVIITVDGEGPFTVRCDGMIYRPKTNRFRIRPRNPRLWSPEEPNLYTVTIQNRDDAVETYFALRTVTTETIGGIPRICLNGKPYFFHGLLDQGYWPDGLFLPGAPEGYTFDIQTMKALGFNTLRKHIKIEPQRFYYDCDRLGMIVFQDLVNSGPYHYLRDTAIPTIGGRLTTYHEAPSERRRNFFLLHGEQTLAHLHNHPCIVLYTLFNEGWGQHDTQALYRHFKAMEPKRIWNAASGWFKNSDSDVQSEHIYFGSLQLKPGGRRPLLLTEFGGYSWPIDAHRFNLDEEYGYQKFRTAGDFQAALTALYRENILPQIKTGLCGAILTQLSDVEDETNGLVTYDRCVIKADREAMTAIAGELMAEIDDRYSM